MAHSQWRLLALISLVATLAGSHAAFGDDWSQWRGPNRDGKSAETGLLKSWPEGGPKRVFLNQNVGLGYSGPAVVGDQLFIMGSRENRECMICLQAATGEEIWSVELDDNFENRWGDGPRATPTVVGNRVLAMSANGNLACVDRKAGKILWKVSMEELGGKRPFWGYCESVLVDQDRVICTPGGSQGTLAALKLEDGSLLWQAKEVTDGAQYSSARVYGQGDSKQYVQLLMNQVVGVSAKDGTLVWSSEFPNGRTAVIPTPIVSENQVYVTAGYGAGCKLVAIEKEGPVDKYENKVMKNHHGGVILLDNHIYGYSDGPGWTCQNFETGESVWNDKKLGKGCVTYADGMLYCVSEKKGEVVLAHAHTSGWTEAGRFTLDPLSEQRKPSGGIWAHPVIANGKLYLRDQEILYCYDIKQ